MAAKKYYAVKRGRMPGIFMSWEECRASVEGYPEAEYQGFARLEEAEGYLDRGSQPLPEGNKAQTDGGTAGEKGSAGSNADVGMRAEEHRMPGPEDIPASGTLLAYVDGSYDDSLKKYAFGCVFLLPDGRIYTEYGSGDNEQSLRHRNVTGEMLGAMYAVKTAMRNGFPHVEIRYDYQGIEKWVTGEWRSKTELTRKYAEAMREWRKNITFSFQKVAAHANVYYNELADKMAKTGLREGRGIPRVRRFEEMECAGTNHGIDETE